MGVGGGLMVAKMMAKGKGVGGGRLRILDGTLKNNRFWVKDMVWVTVRSYLLQGVHSSALYSHHYRRSYKVAFQ